MSHIIAHIFHARNISSCPIHTPCTGYICRCMDISISHEEEAGEKKTKEWDRKQVDDKKYALTYAGYIKIYVEKDIIAIAYWYTRDISFPLFLLLFMTTSSSFEGKW